MCQTLNASRAGIRNAWQGDFNVLSCLTQEKKRRKGVGLETNQINQ